MNSKGIIVAILALGIVAVLASMFFVNTGSENEANEIWTGTSTNATTTNGATSTNSVVAVTPISHASAVLMWDAQTIYTDPVGDAALFEDEPEADLILLTDIHGDHLSTTTLESVTASGTVLIAPQAVADLLPESLLDQTIVLSNGATTTRDGFTIEAVPMYNVPETEESRHVKGRGNGYILERDGTRVYIAGDTGGTPEMRALQDIDVAFVPMNLPFTMSVEDAADAVLAFEPRVVYPYHYRGEDGLSNIEQFRALVNAGNPDIEVVLLDWYPEDSTGTAEEE